MKNASLERYPHWKESSTFLLFPGRAALLHGGESDANEAPLSSTEVMTSDFQLCYDDWHAIPSIERKFGGMVYSPIEGKLFLCGGTKLAGGAFNNIISE